MSDLVGNPLNRFTRDATHMTLLILAANANALGPGSTAVALGGTATSAPGVGNALYTGIGTGFTYGNAEVSYGGGSGGGGGGGFPSGSRGYYGGSAVVGVQAAGMQCGQFRGSRCPYGTSMRGNCGGKKKKCKICCQQVLQRICKTKGKKGPRYYYC